MKIDRNLNLVVPLDTERGAVYVHSTPISRDVYELHFRVLGKAFSQIYQEGYGAISGPRVGALLLKDVAQETRGRNGAANAWEGPDGVEHGLMNEIRRLTNVIMSGDRGWETMPFYDVIKKGMLTPDDVADAEGIICFFTVAYWGHFPRIREEFLTGMALLLGASIVSSNCIQYASSLPTSIADASSGGMAA